MSPSLIDRAVSAIETDRRSHADAALSNPSGRDAFEFGRVVGIHQGLQMATDRIAALRTEDEGREL